MLNALKSKQPIFGKKVDDALWDLYDATGKVDETLPDITIVDSRKSGKGVGVGATKQKARKYECGNTHTYLYQRH